MNFVLRAGYEGAAQLARTLALVAPAGQNKILDSLASRRGLISRYRAFRRDAAQPLLWMHAPSVGEGLQARPVLELMRQRLPGTQLAYTWFSPSARDFAARLDVDFRDVLPFDDTPDMRSAIRALSPSAIVFSKLDVWPTMAREAARQHVKLGLISATLARGSSRRGRIARAILREAYGRLDRVGAISIEDADRLIALGVPARRISVTGDARYDQVWERAASVDRTSALLAPLVSDRPTLVAGSTWPADEAALLEAWAALRSKEPSARLIIAPHEPRPHHLAPIDAWAAATGLTAARLGSDGAPGADVVVVDRVGVLGDLYALADVAFVGGGFHAAGLHSVLEPAAFGVPVVFGPAFAASRDATLLLDADAAISVASAVELQTVLAGWLFDSGKRSRAAGAAAREVVVRGLGAAERSFDLVRSLLRGAAR